MRSATPGPPSPSKSRSAASSCSFVRRQGSFAGLGSSSSGPNGCALTLTPPGVNGQQELTHYGHEELTHRGSARWVTIMRVFPPLARNVSRGRGLGHRDRG